MRLRLVRIFGIIISGLALLGLLTSGHIMQLMNSDFAMDIFRVLLASYLIYVGFVSRDRVAAKTALLILGTLYIGIGLIGAASPSLGSLLQSRLTGFDIIFHLLSGTFAAYVGVRDSAQRYVAH